MTISCNPPIKHVYGCSSGEGFIILLGNTGKPRFYSEEIITTWAKWAAERKNKSEPDMPKWFLSSEYSQWTTYVIRYFNAYNIHVTKM